MNRKKIEKTREQEKNQSFVTREMQSQNRSLGQSRQTPVVTISRLKGRNDLVSMVKTRSNKEQHETKDAADETHEKRKIAHSQKLILRNLSKHRLR